MRAASSTDRSADIRRTVAFQHLDALDDFERVPHRAAEGRIHPGDDRFRRHAGGVAERHQRLGKAPRIGFRLHERAAAGLHVEDERVDPFGDLLAHDRGADEGNALDGPGDIPQRVELLVRRRDLGGLPDHHAADPRQRRLHLVQREIDAEPRNRFELVERPSGVPQAASGHHRNRHAASRRERRQHERCLVADPAGAVLVDFDARDVGQIDPHAGMHHRVGQTLRFLGVHAAEENRHQQRRRLVIGQRASRDPGDEKLNVGAAQDATVAFFPDDVDRAHGAGSIA